MKRNRRAFSRVSARRNFHRQYLIASEGTKTERGYFKIVDRLVDDVHIEWVRGSTSANSPESVLKRIKSKLEEAGIPDTAEAWVVVDKDNWSDDSLSKLFNWSCRSCRFGLALSNPKFEYWLLLHYEAGDNIRSAANCMDRLRIYIPNYDKGLSNRLFGLDDIAQAVERAKRKDSPPCRDWPRITGSTVYRLVQRILGD